MLKGSRSQAGESDEEQEEGPLGNQSGSGSMEGSYCCMLLHAPGAEPNFEFRL